MVNQHQRSEESASEIEEEKISADLLLRSWNKTLETINEAIKINKESGVRDPEQFIRFMDEKPMKIKQKERWLSQCINPKTGEFYTLAALIAAGEMSSSERKLFAGKEYPYRELISMHRRQTYDKKEWLVRTEVWHGLTKAGGVITLSVEDLDWYREMHPIFEYVDKDPSAIGGAQVRIANIGQAVPGFETTPKMFVTPFSKSSVEQAMRVAQPTTDYRLHSVSLLLVKDGASNPTSAPDLETFVNADFDSLWKQQTTPAPVIKVDSRALLNHIESSEDHAQYS